MHVHLITDKKVSEIYIIRARDSKICDFTRGVSQLVRIRIYTSMFDVSLRINCVD